VTIGRPMPCEESDITASNQRVTNKSLASESRPTRVALPGFQPTPFNASIFETSTTSFVWNDFPTNRFEWFEHTHPIISAYLMRALYPIIVLFASVSVSGETNVYERHAREQANRIKRANLVEEIAEKVADEIDYRNGQSRRQSYGIYDDIMAGRRENFRQGYEEERQRIIEAENASTESAAPALYPLRPTSPRVGKHT